MTKTIQINGTIINQDDKMLYDWYRYASTAPNDVVLPTETTEPVVVNINSAGGDIFAGAEIYTKLRAYAGDVTVNIVGIAASAASFVAMAGDHINISPLGQMMIHSASAVSDGQAKDHEKVANILTRVTEQIAESYANRTGRPSKDFIDLMEQETWFTAKSAVEAGLADKLMFEDTKAPELVNGLGILTAEQKAQAKLGLTDARSKTVESLIPGITKLLQDELNPIKRELNDLKQSKGTDDLAAKPAANHGFLF